MEFELEQDNLNPLYPQLSQSYITNSGGVSPEGSGGSGSSSTESERTLVTVDGPSGESTVRQTTSPADSSTDGSALQSRTATGSTNTLGNAGGLDEDDNWTPSAEDIMESTTTRSRPLLALERLRRVTRAQGLANPSPTLSPPPPGANRGRRGARGGRVQSGGGMMDVFAVMAQINEQLDAAPDLDSFLKVVVGVVKDLTQFHRVLVYQFDEVWNGQTVAELVDWSMTHDLYKGLHFPATDIPAQVSLC